MGGAVKDSADPWDRVLDGVQPGTPRDPTKRARHLTDQERAERRVSGGELQAQITDLAELLGWSWCHWRPAPTKRGFYRVPVEGPLGAGWPDLFLCHPAHQRLLAIEVKRELGDPLTRDQLTVHELLRQSGLQVITARPSDLRDPIETSRIYRVLTEGELP